jgi:hypothetical protein
VKLSKNKRSGKSHKGSQCHLQNLINEKSSLLNDSIIGNNEYLGNNISGEIKWVSPLIEDNYLEYQDEEFLEAVGYPNLTKSLSEFWPQGGPVWDALAVLPLKSGRKNGVILLEAKSYIGEMLGPGCCAGEESREKIVKTFEKVQNDLGVLHNENWVGKYYQYANRLSHLYFLQEVHNVPTWLAFLYFLGDKEQGGPVNPEEWHKSIKNAEETLCLPSQHILSQNIVHVILDLERLYRIKK